MILKALLLCAAIVGQSPNAPVDASRVPPAEMMAGGPASVETGRACPDLEDGIRRLALDRLRGSRISIKVRESLTAELARRIVLEAGRFGLDPVVLTAIADVESNFQPWARGLTKDGRRAGEIGIWQLIPGDSPVLEALGEVSGCEPSGQVAGHLVRYWRRSWQGGRCSFPEVAARRSAVGRWTVFDLRDPLIGTWVAAWEIKRHVRACRAHAPSGHKGRPAWLTTWAKRNPSVDVIELDRYVHFNSGGHAWHGGGPYRFRLFSRYVATRDRICKAGPAAVAAAPKSRATAERSDDEKKRNGNVRKRAPGVSGAPGLESSSSVASPRLATGRSAGASVDPGADLPARADGRAAPSRSGGASQ